MGFPRQENLGILFLGLPCPSPGDLPEPGTELTSPGLAGRLFEPLSHQRSRYCEQQVTALRADTRLGFCEPLGTRRSVFYLGFIPTTLLQDSRALPKPWSSGQARQETIQRRMQVPCHHTEAPFSARRGHVSGLPWGTGPLQAAHPPLATSPKSLLNKLILLLRWVVRV